MDSNKLSDIFSTCPQELFSGLVYYADMHAANQTWSDKLAKSRTVRIPKIQRLFAPCPEDAAVANRFRKRRLYFLLPHLWQSCCREDGGWEAVPLRRALWPHSVCGGRCSAAWQEISMYSKSCGIGSTDLAVNKCTQREGSWEESGKEGLGTHQVIAWLKRDATDVI